MGRIAIALLMGLIIGALVGAKLASADQEKAKTETLEKALQDAVGATVKAQAESIAVQEKVDHITLDTQVFKGEVTRHVPRRSDPTDPARGAAADVGDPEAVAGPGLRLAAGKSTSEVHLAYGDDRLLTGAVCLLDAARAGEDSDRAAQRCDEAGDTASPVDVGQPIQADIDAVAAYNQLAVMHNSLVTYVEDLQRKAQE